MLLKLGRPLKELLDADGLCLLDDGFQTTDALKDLENEFRAAPASEEFPQNLIDIFENGLEVEIVTYGGGYCRDAHVSYQGMRHDAESNKYRATSVVSRRFITYF
jgi:hypothetical protein